MKSSLQRNIGPVPLFTIGLWAALVAAAPALMMSDPGMFWHTVVGEQMLTTGEVVRTDTFSFTHDGEPWLAQQWLGELAMAAAHRIGALDSVISVAVALIVLIYSLIFYFAWRSGLPVSVATLLTILTIAASSYHFLPRPHLFTMIGMLILMSILQKLDEQPTQRRILLLLPVFFLVWVNTHGGALGGIATLAIYCALWLCQPYISCLYLDNQTFSSRQRVLPYLAIALGITLITPLINPFGIALPRTWLSLMGSEILPQVIVEHAPLDLLAPEGLMILTLGTVYVYTLVGAWRHQRRVSWLLPAIWLVLACSRVRHGPLFAITAALAIIDMWQHHPRLQHRFAAENSIRPKPRRAFTNVMAPIGALMTLALTCHALNWNIPLIGAGRCNPKAPTWPVAARSVLKALEGDRSQPLRVFNEMRFAGYLIYEFPNAAVYIDDRCELHRDEGLRRYLELYAHPERLIGEIDRFEIDTALVHSGSPFADAFRNLAGWQSVFEDEDVAVFVTMTPFAQAH